MEIALHELPLSMRSSSDFQGLWEGRKTALSFSGLSTYRHFLGPLFPLHALHGHPQSVEEFCFGLLHTARRLGVADGSGDPFQSVDAESLAQVLFRFMQRQQGFLRGPVARITHPFAAFPVDLDLGLGTGAVIVQIRV